MKKNFCRICPIIRDKIKKYFTDIKKFNSKDYKLKNYNKHFNYSFIIMFVIILLFLNYDVLFHGNIIENTLLSGLLAYFMNYIREWYYRKKAEFDYTDLNFGSYGGLLAGLLATLIYILFAI
jgi:hypothetical protein